MKLRCLCGKVAVKDWIQCDHCNLKYHVPCVNGYVDEDSFWLCPPCMNFVQNPPIESKTTLIICPDPILHQWEQEIEKRLKPGSLNVLIYKGTQTRPYLPPSSLALYDIILTTYTVLR
jgi:E3 ubiquitin-protein ligase SHPRH